MAIDFTKTSAQIIVDQILIDNAGIGLTEDLVVFGTPTVVGSGDRNTSLLVTASALATSSKHWTGDVTVTYNRLNLNVVKNGGADHDFPVGSATRVVDLLPQINAQYGINLSASDVVDAALPAFQDPNVGGEVLPVTVTAAAGSLVWIGALTLNIVEGDIPLSTVITTTALNGLVWPGV